MDTRANILLVDDQPLNLDALEAILDAPEHRIVRALSAEEALLALLNEDFAVIVLDIKMPGVSGLELATIIKKRRRTQHIPILFLTAHLLDERDILMGYGAGAVDYLSKPVNPDIFRSKISVFVDLFRKTRALAEANGALQAEISHRQSAQDALREANDALESRVRERTNDLSALNTALRENEERLRLAVSAAGLHAWEMDLATREIRFEPGAPEAFGFPPGSWDGSLDRAAAAIHEEDRERTLASFYGALDRGDDYSGEFRVLRPDGSLAWIINRGRIFRDESGAPARALGVFMDITGRKRSEEALREHNERLDAAVLARTRDLEKTHERLRQTERLASVGTLAAGLGHDMSNLLMPIRARIDSLASTELDAAAGEDVASIREAAGYLQRLASGLRLLAMDPDGGGEREQCTDIASWWRDVYGVFRAALPRGVRLEGNCPEGLPAAAITASRLTQAVFNLVQNAGEATAGRTSGDAPGSITIEVEMVPARAGESGGPRWMAISVCDDGPGMTAEVAARCFEPYFSTKVRAVSTGMGLPMVRAWVEAAGGTIQLRTAPGHGTEFIIELPVAEPLGARSRQAGDGAAPRAALTLDDSRTAGFVSAVVNASGAAAATWHGEVVPDADLWVVSGAAATPERVAAFLAQGGGRRAVVLADLPAASGRGAVPSAPEPGDSVVVHRARYVGRRPGSSELRRCLLESLAGQDASLITASHSSSPVPASA